MKTHPGSTCYVNYVDPSIPTEPCVFRRLYICLKPLVEGFHAGCTKVISLDGCHTKGLYKQQILTTVGQWLLAHSLGSSEEGKCRHMGMVFGKADTRHRHSKPGRICSNL
ncbi:hypothetical protein LIER_33125 [Lithospermum erythrorhizon]|uniref:Uncharacterized protein n=1 Tax=Lithospermum erythrorhizon TaxID=34254 RepID=A0AAV3RZV3_LITER